MRCTCGGHYCRKLVLQEKPVVRPPQRSFVAPPPEVETVGYAWPSPRIRPFSGGDFFGFSFFIWFCPSPPFCPCRSGGDVSGKRPANCLSAASFCRSPKHLRSAGNPAWAGLGQWGALLCLLSCRAARK